MSRSLSAAFTTEKNLLFNRPFVTAIFAFGGAVGNIYVGEFDATIGGNAHKGVAKSWGEYKLVTPPQDGYFPVATAQATLINHLIFSGGTKRFSDLWSGLGPYSVEADIYLNFLKTGTSSEWLQTLAFAAVMRPGNYSPDECEIELKSVSEKYLDKEVGYIINNTDFPNADLDDNGKVANEIAGAVKKVRAHAVVAAPSSVLRAAMTVSSTTVPVHDDFYDLLPATGTVQVGNESIPYTTKSGAAGSRVLGGLTRGSPEAHAQDDTIFQILSEYVYQAAGHEMKSIDVVYVRRGDKTIPLAASAYTLELANSTRVPGKTMAFIKFTSPPLVALKDLVTISDGGVVDSIAANKSGTVSENITANKSGTVTENIGISQTNTESPWEQIDSDETLTFTSLAAGGTQDVNIAFPSQEKTKSSGSFKKQFTFNYVATGVNTKFSLIKGDASLVTIYETGVVQLGPSIVVSETSFWGLKIRRHNLSGTTSLPQVTMVISGKRNTYNIDVAASKTGTVTDGIGVSKAGTVTDGISVSKSGTVTHTVSLSATSTAEKVIGDEVIFDGQGYKDDGSGTYTGTANALIEKCADVLHYLARVVGGIPASRVDAASFVTARTDAPASYKFSGLLTGRSTNLRELMLALGMQCRTRPEWPVDKLQARFIKSSYAAVSAKAVTRDAIKRAALSCRLGPEEDIVNTIQIFYGRDWTGERSQGGFKKVSAEATDATSITRYGTRRRAERYWYDFIHEDNATMANDMRDFELARRKEPPRYVDIVGYLDQFEMLPGDLFAPNYKPDGTNVFDGLDGTKKFIVEEAGFAPGILSRQQGPKMRFVMREVS